MDRSMDGPDDDESHGMDIRDTDDGKNKTREMDLETHKEG